MERVNEGAGRRRNRRFDPPRAAALGAALVVAAALGLTVVGASGQPRLFEVLAAGAVLVGTGVAFGVFDPPPRRRAERPGDPCPQLARVVRDRLRDLDPVEHHRLDLGASWPTVVVGPTGVHVVAPASHDLAADLHRLDHVCARIRGLLADGDRHPPVVGVVVLADDAVGSPATEQATVRTVGPAQLLDVLARGALLPMSVVNGTVARLQHGLVHDLHAV